jgi:Leucine-rich repeat (LRR) protein
VKRVTALSCMRDTMTTEINTDSVMVVMNATITELPALPDTILHLYLCDTPITELPNPLPASLCVLNVSGTALTRLPPLPATLQSLIISHTQIRELPADLPVHLHTLNVTGTPIERIGALPLYLRSLIAEDCTRLRLLPAYLPTSLTHLNTKGCLLLRVRREPMEGIQSFAERWRQWWRQQVYREELMVAAWHTGRVLDWCIDEEERCEWISECD